MLPGFVVPEWLPAWPGEPSLPGPSSLLPPPAGAGPEGSHYPAVASAPAREAKAMNFTELDDDRALEPDGWSPQDPRVMGICRVH